MAVFGGTPTGTRHERILRSPHFRHGRFHNLKPTEPGLKSGTGLSTMREFLFGGQRRTPEGPLPFADPRPGWAAPPQSGLRATWLGHSTLLLEVDGRRVLTDPVWGERASPSRFAGPRRFQPVPVPLEALPPLDAVLVSHDHYDHLDAGTIRALADRGTPFVTALGVGAHLEAFGVAPERITELDWWEQAEVGGIAFHAVPARHFSGRGLRDRNRTLWASWALWGARHRVFFSGDTGLHETMREIGHRHGPFDLVMLEVGAWHPNWGDIHLGPHNAVTAHGLLGGGPLLPIHWGTFNLAMHAWDEPAETLLELAGQTGLPLLTPRLGMAVEPGSAPAVDPWWREVREAGKAPGEPAPPLHASAERG